ncbi:MAG TPA: aminotransferase class I/II-fold pyridoxal phosphate-dependent enzyme [Candidatus Krumholzibacteria bacterium]|nr:aminotransferase class I/II-fold pyridoxal phosphate-dependent enzyme [Candidatus Krumholzibacteria bacterium]HPD72611.1 aminotransferase class I/II-fold pyridoxal phosphate-dependent enzyme [Candidatus Krumholzibacteria bacterium]HRY40457.1 aminotransferase class I/II-fold pyridoxal phosphate-dependent enzyme [Candidatus Krumholzibacteria bacterium]
MDPQLSAHFASRKPSVIRAAQFEFAKRKDPIEAINVAIGDVSLPMHPAMIERLRKVGHPGSPFADGVVRYTTTLGLKETIQAFLNIIAASGFDTSFLHAQITDGGSQAMELVVVGCCGAAGSGERPLLMIDAAYPNYKSFAERLGRRTVSITRRLGDDGQFTLPDLAEIEQVIAANRPGAMVVIPYDNPTGQLYSQAQLADLARLCVKYGLWLISDEAYRELYYKGDRAVSVWGISEADVPGITGRRISIETTSKVWNGCGLRVGALITDNAEFHSRATYENTASLCTNHIGQWIFGSIAQESHDALRTWFARQRDYYRAMLNDFTESTRRRLPGVVVSSPDASIYSVVDVRDITGPEFDALQFVYYCAREGRCEVGGRSLTLLTAPMGGFYSLPAGVPNPGRTQMRVAYVESPQNMRLVPPLLAALLAQYAGRS